MFKKMQTLFHAKNTFVVLKFNIIVSFVHKSILLLFNHSFTDGSQIVTVKIIGGLNGRIVVFHGSVRSLL